MVSCISRGKLYPILRELDCGKITMFRRGLRPRIDQSNSEYAIKIELNNLSPP